MKFLHAHTKVTSRAKTNRTASKSAAYRNGTGKFANRKDQVIYHEVMLPRHCPHSDFFKNPEALWQLVDNTEKRKDAQLFREFEFDLHNDLPFQDQLDAIKDFITENFTKFGMIANFAIHQNQAGKHCHTMLTMREVKKSPFPMFGNKNRGWNDLNLVKIWRQNWQNKLNELAEYYNAEKVSFQSIEFEKQKAIENEDWLLAAELTVKQETALPHKTRAQYSEFCKNTGKTKRDFLISLRKAQEKRNQRRFEAFLELKQLALRLKQENAENALDLENLIDLAIKQQKKQNPSLKF